MNWVWLLVWDASWLIFALLWVSLETKPEESLPQEGGPDGRLGLRKVEPLRNRPVRAPRVHRRAPQVHRR